jgi:hypothetical protein
MGPTAQDFSAAFGLGDTDRAISTVDADRVVLAAIQAFTARTNTLHQSGGAYGRGSFSRRRRKCSVPAARTGRSPP